MSEPFTDPEHMQRAAGLTRETIERINAWIEARDAKKYEEQNDKDE